MPSPYDYVKYDEKAQATQAEAKKMFEDIEHFLSYSFSSIHPSRAVSLARTHLEIAYMWIGKANRDEQIKRNGSAPAQEERTNS